MAKLSDSMRDFLNRRHYATLATFNDDGSIHLTPVWYLFEQERFFVATASDRKYKNIVARPQASLVVDSRRLGAERWVSASGAVEIIRGEPSKKIAARIHLRYLTKAALDDPRIGLVFDAASEVVIALTPQTWRTWDGKSMDDQYFGGILLQTPQKWFLPLD